MFHNVPRVPREKMERQRRKARHPVFKNFGYAMHSVCDSIIKSVGIRYINAPLQIKIKSTFTQKLIYFWL